MWTKAMDAVLRRVIEAGGSYTMAAAEVGHEFKMNLTRNAAIGRGHRIGLDATRSFGGSRGLVTKPRKPRAPKPQTVTRQPPSARVGPESPPQDAEAAALRCVEVTSLELAIYDLNDSTCRYPSADAPFTFCGNPAKEGSPYCGPHHSLCHGYVPPPRRPDAKRPGRKLSTFSIFNFEAA